MQVSFTGLLFLLFLGLKLSGFLDWSWFLVFLPLYLLPLVVFIIGGFAVFLHVFSKMSRVGN